MSVFKKLFRKPFQPLINPVTLSERARLSKTMPGETGARSGERYGFLLN